jgi:predicted ATPase
MGQWRYSIMTDKLTTTLQVAKRIYSLAQEQNDAALVIGACSVLAVTHYYSGDFETARKYSMLGVQLWRSSGVQSPLEEFDAQPVACLFHEALNEWHFGETGSCNVTMAEAISLAKELNDMHGLAVALFIAAHLANYQDNPAQVERLASDLIELTTRQNFALWLAGGEIFRGWARSASSDTAQGISLIEHGIEDWRATGAMLYIPFWLALKAEALYFADRVSEALEAITEADGAVERSGERWWCAELHRLRGVFLTAMGAVETQIEAFFYDAIRIAKQQKSISLEKRAEATCAEYRRQKASGSGGHRFRLPLG